MKRTSILILTLIVALKSYGQDFELVPYRLKTKWGFADSTGTVKIKPVYDDVVPFNRGYSAFMVSGKWGFIDLIGKEILEARYDSVGSYFKGFYTMDEKTNNQIVVTGLRVFKKSKEDFVDVKGQSIFGDKGPERLMIVDDEMETGAYKNKIELIRGNGKVGFKIKKNGYRIEPQYDSLIYSDTDEMSLFGGGEPPYFLAKKKGKWGIITTENTEKLAFEFDELIEIEFDGNKLFKKDGKWGVMDKNLSIVLKNEYDSLIYERGKYLLELKGKWGVLDNKFNVVVPFEYAGLVMTADAGGFCVKNSSGKWGYCNKKGEIKIPMEFAVLEKFKYKDYFKYSDNSKGKYFGLVNIEQTIKIKPIYDCVRPFENGYALIVKKGKQGYINEDGLEFFKK